MSRYGHWLVLCATLALAILMGFVLTFALSEFQTAQNAINWICVWSANPDMFCSLAVVYCVVALSLIASLVAIRETTSFVHSAKRTSYWTPVANVKCASFLTQNVTRATTGGKTSAIIVLIFPINTPLVLL